MPISGATSRSNPELHFDAVMRDRVFGFFRLRTALRLGADREFYESWFWSFRHQSTLCPRAVGRCFSSVRIMRLKRRRPV